MKSVSAFHGPSQAAYKIEVGIDSPRAWPFCWSGVTASRRRAEDHREAGAKAIDPNELYVLRTGRIRLVGAAWSSCKPTAKVYTLPMSERTEDFVKGVILDNFMFKGIRVTIQGNSDDEQEVARTLVKLEADLRRSGRIDRRTCG